MSQENKSIASIQTELHTSFLQHAFFYFEKLKQYTDPISAKQLVEQELLVLMNQFSNEKKEDLTKGGLIETLGVIKEEIQNKQFTEEQGPLVDELEASIDFLIDFLGGKGLWQ